MSLLRDLFRLKNKAYIPPTPRRMFKTHFEEMTEDERRVMGRMGIKSPHGLKVALRRHGVRTVDELLDQLDHYKPRRNLWHRAALMFARLIGGSPHDPHEEELRQLRYKSKLKENKR